MMMVLRSTRSTGDINLTVAGAMRLNFILPAIELALAILYPVLCQKASEQFPIQSSRRFICFNAPVTIVMGADIEDERAWQHEGAM
jgi:hypothetical protein